MTLHLSEYVSGGEIVNTHKNSVHGYLALRGCDRPIVLQLTGNCGPDLAGRHLRFEASSNPDADDSPVTEDQIDELRLGWIQIGVPGEMTANKQPSCLYLEWYGQNGHTVIKLQNPLVEFVEDEEDHQARAVAGRTQEASDSSEGDPEDDEDPSLEPGSQIASFERTDDANDSESESWNRETGNETEDDADDPFGLFPADLEASLGDSSPAPWRSEPDEATLAQWQEWDEVFEGTKDVPLSSLFDPPIQLPPANSLDDEQVARLFNTILAQLARHNVAFHMCEHFTPRSGYTLLVEEILREHGTHPELPRIGYTMNFDTSEYCDVCDAEFERRYAEQKAERQEGDPDDLPPKGTDDYMDDDVPF